MPVLLRKIEANILDNFVTEITTLVISSEIDQEDYINICGLEAFLQNYSSVSETLEYGTPAEFGLLINKKEDFIELEISYSATSKCTN